MVDKQKLATGIQAGTGIAGAIAQAFPGIGSAIGAGVAGAGQLIGMGIKSTIDDPEFMGATGAQKSVLASQQRNLSNLESRQGASALDVQRRYQASEMGNEQIQQQINMLSSADMSPWEKEALAKSFLATMQKTQGRVENQLAEFDARSEAQKQRDINSATSVAADNAEKLRRAEWMAQEQARTFEINKWNNMANQLGATAGAVSQAVTHGVKVYNENKTPDSQELGFGQEDINPATIDPNKVYGGKTYTEADVPPVTINDIGSPLADSPEGSLIPQGASEDMVNFDYDMIFPEASPATLAKEEQLEYDWQKILGGDIGEFGLK